MKTRILTLMVLIAIAVVSCQKDEADKPVVKQDVSFGIAHIDPLGLKNDDFDILCPEDLTPVKARIVIEYLDEDNNLVTETFEPLVFFLNGKWYTQAIKLAPGAYTIKEFYLLDVNDDEIMATPAEGSVYAVYVEEAVDIDFEVSAFTKIEIPIDVLCYEPARYDEFGFFWFQVDRIVVREKCFFGDICLKSFDDYNTSLYAQQANGLQIDMPAIFEIRAYRGIMENGDVVKGAALPKSPYSNEDWLGEGAPLCVEWPDNIDIAGEQFIFELWIYVAIGDGFGYVYFHTWTFADDALLTEGDVDGVIDFVLGNCNYSSTDLQLAPYMNLPQTASINIQHDSLAYPWYWNMTINSVSPAGTYDIPSSGFMAGWCGDADEVIGNGPHTFSVYSSLVPASWPAGMPAYITAAKLNSVNWLFNNLGTYGISISGMYIDPLDNLSLNEGRAMQNTIWRIINDIVGNPSFYNEPPGLSSTTMATAALLNSSFTPLPGGWAAIILVPHDTNGVPDATKAQLIMTVVDP